MFAPNEVSGAYWKLPPGLEHTVPHTTEDHVCPTTVLAYISSISKQNRLIISDTIYYDGGISNAKETPTYTPLKDICKYYLFLNWILLQTNKRCVRKQLY
jgi:hypothetical protein